jgi:hypothetical protein
MQNLVFDQANPELAVCRPGVGDPIIDFNGDSAIWNAFTWGAAVWGAVGFTGSTFISVHVAIGDYIYGMVDSNTNPGYEEPFCFKIDSGFIPFTGVAAGNVPAVATKTGDWTPPTMAVIGINIIVTHPGFSGTNYFGVIDITDPAAPTWDAQNTTTNVLPSIPAAVANFNNRAWFACENTLWYSDSLAPTVMTNAGQSLTISDTTPITALEGMPIQTTSAGVVSSLTVFKEFQIWQVKGDPAISTDPLSLEFLTLAFGTKSPRSVASTPSGLIFIGLEGPCVLISAGGVLPLFYDSENIDPDVQKPFQQMLYPSRAAGAFCGSVYRICIISGTNIQEDYWFDVIRRRWSGPHSFGYDCASKVGRNFTLSNYLSGAALFLSGTSQANNIPVHYNDNGVPITVILESSQFPKTPNINMKQVIESTIEISAQSDIKCQVTALDDLNVALDSQVVSTASSFGGVWGTMTWGVDKWGSSTSAPATATIPWSIPLVFKKMSVQVIAQSSSYLSIGSFFAKYRDAGYTNK